MKVSLFLTSIYIIGTQAFPLYNQQCRDDAGPPYLDDSETYPNGRYHDNSQAWPILVGPNENECPAPLAAACASRGDAKTAYLEGPIDCNGNGWYCRILQDENFDGINLPGDLNFKYCNRTEEAADEGHCHGSSYESTYYWWVRDHWFRQYNGRLRCCCNWGNGNDPITSGWLTNRCDYRRLVTDDEDVTACRDANEGHGLSYEGGCDSSVQTIDEPISEDDSMCWEVQHFGFVEGSFTPPPISPVAAPTPTSTGSPPPTNKPSEVPTSSPVMITTPAPIEPPITPSPIINTPSPTTAAPVIITPSPTPESTTPQPVNTVCQDDVEFEYRGNTRTCDWASQIICRRTTWNIWEDRVYDFCRDSCDYDCYDGEDCVDEEPFEYRNKGEKYCEWAVTAWCNIKTRNADDTRIRDHCRESCGVC